MFIETGRFSTRTVAAINNLEGAEMRHKKEGDYQWRKEMEEWVQQDNDFIDIKFFNTLQMFIT